MFLVLVLFSTSVLQGLNLTCFVPVQEIFDYEVDSDDEWEEEEPGESVSSDEVSACRIMYNWNSTRSYINFE